MTVTTMATPAEVRQLKAEGQERGARSAGEVHREAFRAAVRKVPVGQLFTVNDLRADLDVADVPPASRGFLMGMVAREGLAEIAQYMGPDGRLFNLEDTSSGRSARGAGVRAYVRLATGPGGPP
jgi:hypothetical protein